MPQIGKPFSHETNGSVVQVWDWDGSNKDLNALYEYMQDVGGRVSVTVAIPRPGSEELFWFSAKVQNAFDYNRSDLASEIRGAMIAGQKEGYESGLQSASDYQFSGIGISIQAW